MKRLLPRLVVAALTFVIGVAANAEANRLIDYSWPDAEAPPRCLTPSAPVGKGNHPLAQIIAHSRGH